MCLLENIHLKNNFLKWQFQHQITHHTAKSGREKAIVALKMPPKHDVLACKAGNNWHIPLIPKERTFIAGGFQITRKTHLIPDKYLCLSLKSISDNKVENQKFSKYATRGHSSENS